LYVVIVDDVCDRSNININDVLGDYSLTLVDVLDTLAVRFLFCSMYCQFLVIKVK